MPLCVFAPNFAFKAQAAGRVAVEAFGQTLIAVSLDILLEGPSLARARPRFGQRAVGRHLARLRRRPGAIRPPLFEEPPPIEDELRPCSVSRAPGCPIRSEPKAPASCCALPPGRRAGAPPAGPSAGPAAALPFNVTISRYDGADLHAAAVGNQGRRHQSADQLSRGDALRDEFPRAHYFGLSESDQLSARGFTREVSGVLLVAEESRRAGTSSARTTNSTRR